MELFTSGPSWLDAFSPPLEQHLVRLWGSVERLLVRSGVTVSESVSEPAPPADPERVEGRAGTSRRAKRPSHQKRKAVPSRDRKDARAPEPIFRKVQALIAEQLGVDRAFVQLSSSFEEDLRADSLTLVELVMALEEVFNLPDITEEDAERIKTVGDVVNYILDRR
ncbi:MAG: acyl carrier protein [Armatimonadota bacterium]|nr:MAG: acyl carrier protein [Armatimonadota bacterium]